MGVVELKDMPLGHHHLLPLVRVTRPSVQEHDVRDMVFGQQRQRRRTRETFAGRVGVVQIDVLDEDACGGEGRGGEVVVVSGDGGGCIRNKGRNGRRRRRRLPFKTNSWSSSACCGCGGR